MLILDAYTKTWTMCLFSYGFFAVVAVLVTFFRAPRLDFQLPRRFIFRVCLLAWFSVLSICLTLIDKPRIGISKEMLDWMFMFCAFLFIPVSIPLLVGAIWALIHDLNRETMRVSSFCLVMLTAFALGCAASNIHDIVWCGVITNGYTEHFKAGYDLDVFVAFAEKFGITREIAADYATLGPYAMVLVLGELLVACSAHFRLRSLYVSQLGGGSVGGASDPAGNDA